MSQQLHTLKVSKIHRETPEACTIYFDTNGMSAFAQRKAGQYLTLEEEIDGEPIRRAYSICSAPHEADLAVTVKQLYEGKMSTYLNTKLKEGMSLKVGKPEGHFVLEPEADRKQAHVFVAAGSGITPILAMIKTVLEEEPMSTCYLLYGNRNEGTIIFDAELKRLGQLYAGQLVVEHVLSRPHLKRQPGLSGLFKKPLPTWQGRIGRIDAMILEDFIKAQDLDRQRADYYLCGPAAMIEAIDSHLQTTLEDKGKVHVEYFTTPDVDPVDSAAIAEGPVAVRLRGEEHSVNVPSDKTILDALIDLKLDPPYSCSSGACSSCMAKVTAGSVAMDACFALDDDEVEDGYILACQAHPTSAGVRVDFDV